MPNPITFTYNEVEIEIPTKYEVCGECNGEGKHVHRDVDGHGITADEFAEDPDFAEEYFAGVYDVPCDICNGKRVERVPDWDGMTPELQKHYEAYLDGEAECRADRRAERRMGA